MFELIHAKKKNNYVSQELKQENPTGSQIFLRKTWCCGRFSPMDTNLYITCFLCANRKKKHFVSGTQKKIYWTHFLERQKLPSATKNHRGPSFYFLRRRSGAFTRSAAWSLLTAAGRAFVKYQRNTALPNPLTWGSRTAIHRKQLAPICQTLTTSPEFRKKELNRDAVIVVPLGRRADSPPLPAGGTMALATSRGSLLRPAKAVASAMRRCERSGDQIPMLEKKKCQIGPLFGICIWCREGGICEEIRVGEGFYRMDNVKRERNHKKNWHHARSWVSTMFPVIWSVYVRDLHH